MKRIWDTPTKKCMSPLESVDVDDENDAVIEQYLRNRTLATIFTERHPNLTSVVLVLMAERNLHVLVQEKLIDSDDSYWTTGNYDAHELDMFSVHAIQFCTIGRVQQVVTAGLQILYKTGPQNKTSAHYSVLYYADKTITNIRISFKFKQRPINLSIVESLDALDPPYLSLYVAD